MFDYWKKIDALNQTNKLLLVFSLILTLIVIGLLSVLISLPKRYEFWLSPNILANGGLMQEGQIPDEYVQGFVSTLIPTLNSWSKSGKKEFTKNLNEFHYYFTPRHQQLMKDTLTVYKDAQLFSRTQVASLYRFMEPGDIKPLGKNMWEVRIILRITQRLKSNSPMVIADKVVEYHLRVVKIYLSHLHNPFELALDGYTQPERLITDLLANNQEELSHEN